MNEKLECLKKLLSDAEAVVIGAGAGLSASAGFDYSAERFLKYFSDFAKKYKFEDMYTGGFYPFEDYEEFWAYWSRYIYINRYVDPPKPVYNQLLELVSGKDHFVITTNVDHCFQKAGFDKRRLFYTQGDYGLWQCSEPCHQSTYDNSAAVRDMVEAQGYKISENGSLECPENTLPLMRIPAELIPRCPRCGRPMTMNLRSDDTFVEDDGWHRASEAYVDFINDCSSCRTLFLELGVGSNTPGIIKYPFRRMTVENIHAVYVSINKDEVFIPQGIAERSLSIAGDIGDVLCCLLGRK